MRKEFIIIAFILSIAILCYGFLNYVTKNNELNQKNIIEYTRAERLQSCLSDVFDAYDLRWNKDSLCVFDKNQECRLPAFRANEYDENLKIDRDRCATMYK